MLARQARRFAACLSLAVLCSAAVGCAAEAEPDEAEPAVAEDMLVGGKREARWAGSGFLLRGDSIERLDETKVACGATLIAPNVVVTAAHCVTDAGATFAFGTGDVGSSPLVKVIERHAHPKYHPEAVGRVDLVHALRKYDVAYLVLERVVDFAKPAELIAEKPPVGCNVQAIGYRAEGTTPVKKSTPACVLFRVTLGTDPIFEVHPQGFTALCQADGDEGSPVVQRSGDRHVLVGIFVGSVTQGLTDCRRGTQYLNGYESMYGYGDFLRAGIARARQSQPARD